MPKFRFFALTLLAYLGTAVFAGAQYTTITASSLKLSGSNITAGVVTFTPVDVNGIAIVFVDGNGAQNGPTAFSCTIANGAITTAIGNNGVAGGTCVLPDTTMTTPVNVAYNIQVCDTSTGLSTSGKCYVLGGVYGVSGTTWPLDHYGPPARTVNSQQLQSALGANVPTTCVAPALFTKSTNAALYTCVANRYIQVLGSSSGGGGSPSSYPSFNSIATPNALVATDGSANFIATGLTASNGSLYSTYLNATGAAAVGSLTSAGAISSNGSISATGSVSAATLSTTGTATLASVVSSGNVTGNTVTSTGVATVGSLSTAGAVNAASVTASGSVNSASVVASGAISAGASVSTPAIISKSVNSVLSADQFSGVDIQDQINAAIAACPTVGACKITIPPGAYTSATMVTIPGTLQYIELDCQGATITWTGSGDQIQVAQRNDADPTGVIRNCRFVNGGGNTTSLASVHQFSRIWFSYINNTFYGFNNPGGVGIELDNNAGVGWPGYNERTFFLNNSFSLDTKGVEFKGSNGGTNSFARQTMIGTKCNMIGGQYCLSVEGNGGFQSADVYDSMIDVKGNLSGTNARAVSVANGGDLRTGTLNANFEGPNTSYLIYTDNIGTSAVVEAGTLSPNGLQVYSAGTSDQINIPQLNADFVLQNPPFANSVQQALNSKVLWSGNSLRYGIPNAGYNYAYFQLFKRTTGNPTDPEVDAEPTTGNTQISMMYCNVGGCGFGPGYGPSATRGGTTAPTTPLEVGGSPVCTQASGCPAVGSGSGALYTSPTVNFMPKVTNATSPGTMGNSSISDNGTTVATTEALSTGAITAPSATINGSPVCTTATGCGAAGIVNIQVNLPSGAQIAANTCTAYVSYTMTGVAATSTFTFSPATDSNAVVGWGVSTGGLYPSTYATANTLHVSECNGSPVAITPGALTFNVSAK